MKFARLLLMLCLLIAPPAMALSPDEILPDPALEARARDISAGLRCLVCQNQSIDDSDADLARDLRVLVRERLVAGDSNAEVEQFVVDRYGEYVLLNPRLGAHTILLWIAAPVLLLIGLGTLWLARRRAHPVAADGLTSEEQQALDELR
jgi:cytochrome c-type biogenesis protein CcmH